MVLKPVQKTDNIFTSGPIRTLSSNSIPPKSTNIQDLFINTSLPILILRPKSVLNGVKTCTEQGPIRTLSSNSIPPKSTNIQDLFINTSLPILILRPKSVLNGVKTCTEQSILFPVISDKIPLTSSGVLYPEFNSVVNLKVSSKTL